jgi:hypothetical protein
MGRTVVERAAEGDMGWLQNRSGKPPKDVAERLTSRGLFRTTSDTAALSDDETVRRWLRELQLQRDQQIFVHRPWGTVVAVADRRHTVQVFFTDGDKTWVAVPPGAGDDTKDLTPAQVSLVVLDALTASAPPAWPDWRYLI